MMYQQVQMPEGDVVMVDNDGGSGYGAGGQTIDVDFKEIK